MTRSAGRSAPRPPPDLLAVGRAWAHALAVGDGPAHLLVGVACSVEGDPGRDVPARVVSPAYQDIQSHDDPKVVRLLLTGQSTPHHFSAVVTVRKDGNDVVVEFDVADRCRAPVAALAATYLVSLGSGALIDAGPDRIVWGGDALGRGRLEFSAEDPNSIALAEAGRQATRVQALTSIVPGSFTHRLVYRWRWTPPTPNTLYDDLLGHRA